jgi:hypothetical protein
VAEHRSAASVYPHTKLRAQRLLRCRERVAARQHFKPRLL